ncbi:cupin domain-containing protein [Rhodobacteraceae bacterium RKSG542]|uniref:ChrR family anti-sigma-E factor n=1 Tax=Pseudovibrio flavus TaxID=2529854 RepID=UPI0012BC4C42|nr:ChrR family anti-sigma-E factor [Pseudovibrio flavus]MTI16288.1 cupin domain-containing protein [Pseudovibrio flavus]
MINHHPSDETILSYAAGAMSAASRLFVSSHLSVCESCRERVRTAEVVGGVLLNDIECTPVSADAFDQLMARIDSNAVETSAVNGVGTSSSKVASADMVGLPEPLQLLLDGGFDELKWKTVAPGVKQYPLPVDVLPGEKVRLLKLSPGFVTPEHSHHGHEMTMVLKGSFSDETGRYKAGDVQEMDGSVHHQPIADTEEDCICLVVTDAPLQFKGVINKLLQPFIGF